MVEQEVADGPDRDQYQRRRAEQKHHGYRNAYEPGHIRTAEGEIVFQAPSARWARDLSNSQCGPLFSSLCYDFLAKGYSRALVGDRRSRQAILRAPSLSNLHTSNYRLRPIACG